MLVPASYQLPNIRSLYKPDPGHVLLDLDMSGADAQVVAWEANDHDLKRAFRSGTKIHIKNFEDMWGRPFDESRDKRIIPAGHNYTPYDSMKRAVHATNYSGSPRTLAATLGWKFAEAKSFQDRWFQRHPGIKEWQRRVELQLNTTRKISNKFNYSITYFDRPGGLLPEALAWIPQSTVAILAARAFTAIEEKLWWLDTPPLAQVHDSILIQIPESRYTTKDLKEIHTLVHQPVPYGDPLLIQWGISASHESWGSVKKINWSLEP